jgi:hypothetical protein
LAVQAGGQEGRPLELASQFSADVEVISELVNRSQVYPPWLTRMSISYDYAQGLARAQIHEGHNAGKVYVRRYDEVRSR